MALEEEYIGLPEDADAASSAQESASESKEGAKSRSAAAGKAAQRQKKKEQRAKKRDYSLAALLSSFLKSGNSVLHQQLLVTCLQLVEDDISPTFILAILSLLFPELERLLLLSKEERSASVGNQEQLFVRRSIALATTTVSAFDIHHFPPAMQEQVKSWIKVIQYAVEESTEEEQSALVVEGSLHFTVSRLVIFILEEFLRHNRIQAEFREVELFAANIIGIALRK